MTSAPILPAGRVLPVATAVDLERVGRADLDAVQWVLDASTDFAMLVDGSPPPPDEARRLLEAVPPGSDPADKAVMLVRCAGVNLGVVDIVRDWPRPGTWMLGLLVLVPAARGMGIGSRVLRAVDTWAADSGAERIRISVAPVNTRGLAFWRREGFRPVEHARSGPYRLERPILGKL